MNDVVMIGVDSPNTWMVFNAVDRAVGVGQAVIEDRVPARALLRARARRFGWLAAAGQVAFRVVVIPILRRQSTRRCREIRQRAGLNPTPPSPRRVTRVPSINDPLARAALEALAPAVVVVAGTRIIAGSLLGAVPATFLNLHAGITPRYRGVHGGYWALASGDAEHCGVTVHVVDEGVDTGHIIAQAQIAPTHRDTFVTYPLLQLHSGLPLLIDAVRAALDNRLQASAASGPSRQWYHPTVGGYLMTWLRTGVR
jgi:folate-dependent phosphoribosylglycinamide formyltransferase PurN